MRYLIPNPSLSDRPGFAVNTLQQVKKRFAYTNNNGGEIELAAAKNNLIDRLNYPKTNFSSSK
jgi:hypothetical protein